MNNYYDIIVVGAGPAGSVAALQAAEKGVSVLLLEKDKRPGTPVRCGEAVNASRLKQFIDPDPSWICATVDTFSFIAPDGSEVTISFEEEGYILDRKIFDHKLAINAVKAGAELITDAYVYDLSIEEGTVKGVKVEISGIKKEIKSQIVIGADGVESRVGRFAGLKTFTDYRDMECCTQVFAENADLKSDKTCYLYFGENVAPNGYLWVFPKGKNSANIGLGINGPAGKTKSASRYLDDFLNANYPGIEIKNRFAGGVPCTVTLKNITAPGIMLTGDAARQVNPLSGGGITSGMTAGSICGRVAAESILMNNPRHINKYAEEWHDRMGKKHEIYNRIKEGIYNFDNRQLNRIAKSFLKIPVQKRSLGRLFTTALVNNPSLIVEVGKVFLV